MVSRGKIPVTNGKIDPVAADAALAGSGDTRANRRAVPKAGNATAAREYVESPVSKATAADRDASARLKNLRIERESGTLCAVESVDRGSEGAGAALREGMMRAAAGLAMRIGVVTSDRQRIDIVEQEFERLLSELASTLDLMADQRRETEQ